MAFYVDILKFSISYQRKDEGFAFLTLGEAQIMIDEIGKGRAWKTGELNYPLGRGVNLQIKVKSIDILLNSLKKQNIELFMETEEKWYAKDKCEIGHRQFLVMDPDGYLLRFTEELWSRPLK